jgi:predicted Rossmann fold nucleotide-binding protein DprA/Smf involved in DNA uptake
VFAVPGDVSRSTSVGTNLLIRDGALPVLGPDDLVEAVSLVLGPPPRASAPEAAQLGIDIPAEGASVEMIVEAAGGDVAGVLAQLGRLESDGRIRIEDGEVLPIG